MEGTSAPLVGQVKVQTPDGVRELAYANVNGDAVAEGDIVLGPIAKIEGTARNASIVNAGDLWTTGRPVYYRFNGNLSQTQLTRARDAVAYWREKTDVDLREIASEHPDDLIEFRDGGNVCQSNVGRAGGVQYVDVASWCDKGSLTHEIGHAMGFWHEQSRHDRDNYVTVNFACVQPDQRHNYDKYSSGADLGPYDFNSIMHYGSGSFCIDDNNDGVCDCEPMTKKDGSRIVANRSYLSELDLRGAAALYGPRVGWQGVWHGSFAIDNNWPNVVKKTGDFNGDNKDDVVAFLKNTANGQNRGFVRVALSDGSRFGVETTWNTNFCMDNETCAVADVNGDNKDDIVALGGNGIVWVATSNGSSFVGIGNRWTEAFCYPGETCMLGDVNGDRKADLVAFAKGWNGAANQGDVYVALSTGTSFGPRYLAHDFFCIEDETCLLGDVNGDRIADLVLTRRDGVVYQALGRSNGTFGQAWSAQPQSTCVGAKACAAADMTGDGLVDIVSFWGNTRSGDDRGDVRIARRSTSPFNDGFLPERLAHGFFCVDSEQCAVGDVNGDGRADLVTFTRNLDQSIWVSLSQRQYANEQR